MKYMIMGAAFAVALGGMQFGEYARAQSNEVRTMCMNKHGLGRRWNTASEGERKDAARKVDACIRSGGKS